MTSHMIVKAIWPIALLLFLGLSVSQLAESLTAKTASMAVMRPHERHVLKHSYRPAPTRVNAMLGSACILLAAFWGFDVMLAWWLDAIS